jgi:hypothetical protein
MKIKKETIIFFDDSALKAMFEGDGIKKAKQLLEVMNKVDYANGGLIVKTSISCFLRAIFLADGETKIKDIQKCLNFLQVLPSFADFKDGDAVTKEVLKIADLLAGGKHDKREKI